MTKLPKWMYWLIFACVMIAVIGVIVSRVVREQAFEIEDAVLLLTSVVGFIFKIDDRDSGIKPEQSKPQIENDDEPDTTASHFDDDD